MLLQRSEVLVMVVFAATVIAFFCGDACVFAQDEPVNASETAKSIAAQITGLDGLSDVRVTANSVTITKDDDDTPLSPAKDLLINRPLWKVSYEVDALVHPNKVNPHIRGFDTYVDISTGQVLKVVSRDDPNMPEQYRTGVEVSNKEIASILTEDVYVVQDRLPTVVPTFKFADMIMGNGIIARHYECYYFLFQHRSVDGGQIIPAWLVVLHGTEPIRSLGPTEHRPARHRSLAESYRRTFKLLMLDAESGDVLLRGSTVGSNDDLFD